MADWDEAPNKMNTGAFGGSANEWNQEFNMSAYNENSPSIRTSGRGRIGVRSRGRGRGNIPTNNTSPVMQESSWQDTERDVEFPPLTPAAQSSVTPQSSNFGGGGNTQSAWNAVDDSQTNFGNSPSSFNDNDMNGWASKSREIRDRGGNRGAGRGGSNEANSGWGASTTESSTGGWGGGFPDSGGGGDSFSSGRSRGGGRGRGGRGGACFKCGEEGHMSRECPSGGGSSNACFKCGEEGHMSRECPSGGSSRACFKCGEEGHMSRECPSGGGGGQRSSGCHNCGEEGHFVRDCPQPRKERGRGRGSSRGSRSNDSSGGFGGGNDNSGGGWGGGSSGGGGWNSSSNQENGFSNQENGSSGGGAWGGGFGGDVADGDSSRGRGRGRGRGSGRGGSSSGCFKCGEEGHMSRECPSAESGGGGGGSKGCHNCGGEGHFARECPEPKKEREPRLDENGEEKPAPMTYVPVDREIDDLFQDGVDVGVHFSQHQNIPVKVSGGDYPEPIKHFGQANLRQLIMENVNKAKYTVPTPIQQYAIPIILAGRDMMACAQTGSGKTAGFLLPILHYIMENEAACTSYDTTCHPVALIVSPTRELGIQIYDEARKFCNGSVVKVSVIYGGTAVFHQRKSIQNGCHILVATPGRLGDFIEKDFISLSAIKFLVLDEADRMLDMGFIGDIEKLVRNPNITAKEERQTLMFSATFPTEIQNLARSFLKDYLFVAVGMVGAANSDVKQIIISMDKMKKRDSCLTFINERVAQDSNVKILVFVDKKRTADFLAAFLSKSDVNSTSIHGDRVQSQREQALRDFKKGRRNVLVATAVAARGLDIKGVGYVLNYDLPKDIDEYVHRIGRTGRVGNIGHAISYFDAENDVSLSKDLIKVLGDAEQEIPDFLREAGSGMSSVLSYEGSFMSTDVRSKRGAPSHYEHTKQPAMEAVQEEEW